LARQIQRGKSKAQAEQIFRTRFAPNQLLDVDPSGSPSKGPENAPITIVEWADFECAFCQRAAPVLSEQATRLKDRIRFVYKHFPIAKHPNAVVMAKFAVAAENQGKFWEAYDRLFAGEGGTWDALAVETLSVKLGLDPKKVALDMASPETDKRLARDREQADRLGLKGTPFILINRRKFDFDLFDLEEDLADWLDTEVELSSSGALKP
jgi:protein-disulfide isomerase